MNYQSIVKGGIKVVGFSVAESAFSEENKIVDIPHEGQIKEAFLITYSPRPSDDFNFSYNYWINNQKVTISDKNFVSSVPLIFEPNPTLIQQGVKDYALYQVDITNFLNDFDQTLSFKQDIFSPPNVCPGCHVAGFAIIIVFETSNGNNVNFTQILNQNPESTAKELNFNLSNTIDTLYDIGLGIMSDRAGGGESDGLLISINNNLIGCLCQNDQPENISGVMGCFNYENGNLTGSCDDNADSLLRNSNGIMKLNSSHIENDSLHLKVEYSPNSNPINLLTPHNILLGYNLVYSTPCEPFEVVVPRDTTLCQGTSLSLQASGGQRYKWLPETGLSCYDCANPTFTADTTTFYSLQIFNNDSCSVIRTVRLFVEEPKTVSVQSTSASFCGGATGGVIMQANSFYPRYSVNGTLFPMGNNLQNLASGNYTVVGISTEGCPSFPLQVTVDSINNTVADFWRTPLEGAAPLNVSFVNKSEQASFYLWQVDSLFYQNIPNPYTFTEPGWHTITLYAWKYDTLCADTVSKTVFVRIPQIIPTAFTPNNDGDNDVWELPYIDVLYPENQVFVYNRWGNLLYTSQKGTYASNPWDGTFEGKPLPVGSYFYVIETNDPDFPKMNGQVSVIRK
ncbi:MAG: gliding motility-associated C-terminal domain-containing protein [Flavobacteriales bacterium]|nr:gliding motility-associated C-terminal domain-containing protein [Flavobacteriales bacterium]